MNKHFDFIRSLPCVSCNELPPSEVSHIRKGTNGGMGLKPGDNYTVPQCRNCHMELHRIGEQSFWGDMDRVILLANQLFNTKDWGEGVRLILDYRRENEVYSRHRTKKK